MSLDRDDRNEEKRRRMERGDAQSLAPSPAPRRRVALGADGRPLDGVTRGELLRNLKHGDGSIYRSNSYWVKIYRLYDTDETCLESMMMTVPNESCMPNWKVCKSHGYCTMMQIFSLKLAYTSSSVGGPVQLYGYVAVRDLLNPMRNYLLNRTRDDPFVLEHGDLIQMSGPKRGIRMQAPVLIEFDMKIKRGGEHDDLQLLDGVALFSDFASRHARVCTRRFDGDCGSVDLTFALLDCASEATVQVGVSELQPGSCLNLCLAGSYAIPSSHLHEKIQLFHGFIAAEASELSKTVVAVAQDTRLVVTLKLSQSGGSDIHRWTIFPVQKHARQIFFFKLGLATVEVKVNWSTMDFPQDLLGPNCFKREFWASRGVEYVDG